MGETLSQGKWRATRHLSLLSDTLADSIYRQNGVENVMASMPPRHGKSYLTSWWTPVWVLDLHPEYKIGLASYELQIAAKWGRLVRNTIQEHTSSLRVRVSRDSKARSRWDTTAGGGMLTAGVDGPFTGEGFQVLILDDLYKNWRQSKSHLYRDMVWDWFLSTALTRLEPGGVIWIPMTRWDEDDIIGRIQAQAPGSEELEDRGLEFTEICLPALALENDLMGRKEGEALWPERYPAKRLLVIKRTVGHLIWRAVFMQRPLAGEGKVFARQQFRYWRPQTNGSLLWLLTGGEGDADRRVEPRRTVRFATVDLAAKDKEQHDYVVFSAWALTHSNDLLLVDRIRFKSEAPGQLAAARQFFARNGGFLVVESVAYQHALIALLRRGDANHAPVPCREFHPGRYGDKIARARSAQVFQEGGQLYYPAKAEWLDEWEEEIVNFPNVEHDDQVDTQSMAVLEVVNGRIGVGVAAIELDSELLERVNPWGD
jgi:predicted phage terminase large subunit-like protein